MAPVRLRDVKKSYGSVTVMHGVSLDIQDGEFLILVGPSGCGKSTLLRMVAGLEDITDGEIFIDERVVNDVEPKERDIAMVFQNYALYPHMTVAENMAYSLKIKGVPKDERMRQVHEAADILDLANLLDRKPKQLSGGQRQRVAMGRAIVRHPKVFLFDEPLSNLDAKLRVAMRAEIKALHHKLKTTVIYVTHDQIEAMTMADRIVVMNSGRVEQVGTPLELYDSPDNLFVASFIGSPAMNLLDAEVVRSSAGLGAKLQDGTVWPVASLNGVEEGHQIVIGVRPEHFRVADNGEPSISTQVQVVEPTGSETQVISSFGDTRVNTLFRDRVATGVGEALSLAPLMARVHLFDKKTGNRLT